MGFYFTLSPDQANDPCVSPAHEHLYNSKIKVKKHNKIFPSSSQISKESFGHYFNTVKETGNNISLVENRAIGTGCLHRKLRTYV